MEAQHRGPLVGFVVVALTSGFIVGHALSTQSTGPLARVVAEGGQGSPSAGASEPSARPGDRTLVVVAVPGSTPGFAVVKTIGKAPVVEAANGLPGTIIGLPTPADTQGDPDGDGVQARDGKGTKGGGNQSGAGDQGAGDQSGADGDDSDDVSSHEPQGTPPDPPGQPEKPTKPDVPEPDDHKPTQPPAGDLLPGAPPEHPGEKPQQTHEKRLGD